MKQCSKCQVNKDLSEFSWRSKEKEWRFAYCKPCRKIYDQERYNSINGKEKLRLKTKRKDRARLSRQFIWNYLLENPCIDCGETNPIVLQFDHVRDIKKYTIGNMGQMSIQKIKDEINKCDVRCANCHTLKTAKQFNWYKHIVT